MILSNFKQTRWKSTQSLIYNYMLLDENSTTCFCFFHCCLFQSVGCFGFFCCFINEISSRCETDMWYFLSTHDAPCECHFCHFETSLTSWYAFFLKICFCYSSGYRIVIKISALFCVCCRRIFIHERANIKFRPPHVCSHCGFNGYRENVECEMCWMFVLAIFLPLSSWTVINYAGSW